MKGKVRKYGYIFDLDKVQVSVDKEAQKYYSKADLNIDFTPEYWARIEEAKKKVNKISDEEAERRHKSIMDSATRKAKKYGLI